MEPALGVCVVPAAFGRPASDNCEGGACRAPEPPPGCPVGPLSERAADPGPGSSPSTPPTLTTLGDGLLLNPAKFAEVAATPNAGTDGLLGEPAANPIAGEGADRG